MRGNEAKIINKRSTKHRELQKLLQDMNAVPMTKSTYSRRTPSKKNKRAHTIDTPAGRKWSTQGFSSWPRPITKGQQSTNRGRLGKVVNK